jgi:ATP-dependent RNA helicase RhlE
VSQFRQVKSLQRGVDILVATPGRLLDLMDQGYVDLSNIEMFVLDEADRMLDMGFINPIRKIAQAFTAKPQTLLFSATMPKPIAQLAETLLTNPEKVTVNPVSSAVPLIEQSLYLVDGSDKPALLTHMLGCKTVERAVVFIRTKHGAEKLAKVLGKAGIKAESIHGNKNQNQRTRALDSFRTGRSRVLVATDVAARGLDVDGITHVFNFSIPNEPEAYVHRIGRTGRAGRPARPSPSAPATSEPRTRCSEPARLLQRPVNRDTSRGSAARTARCRSSASRHLPAAARSDWERRACRRRV